MSSFAAASIAALEYHDPEMPLMALAEPVPACEPVIVDAAAAPALFSEQDVEDRVAHARADAEAEGERRLQVMLEEERLHMRRRLEKTLEEFGTERVAYFQGVERELVQLALAIVRKILQRETQLDPTLLGALVRIALDRMQCEGAVRLRVPRPEGELWRGMQGSGAQKIEWTIVVDESLDPGDCIVETDIGSANFGLEAQMRSVEESLLQLMTLRPERP